MGRYTTGGWPRLSRRGFVRLGAAVAAGVAVRGMAWTDGTPTTLAAGDPLVEPAVLRSRNGRLKVTLEAKIRPVTVAGQTRKVIVYNGSFPGPTLVVEPGDRLEVKLENELAEHTNIHTHGFHVSPERKSDNVLVDVEPRKTFHYEFDIPADHPAGLNWYHPHFHMRGTQQLFGGMAGAIVIRGGLDRLRGIRGLQERLLILQTTKFDDGGNVPPFFDTSQTTQLRLVNGQLNPTLSIRQGQLQRWRILNASVNMFFDLSLTGHKLLQIAADGNPFNKVVERDTLLLGPGQRAEVLVRGGPAGSYELHALPFNLGQTTTPNVVLATLVAASAGRPFDPIPPGTTLLPFQDLRGFSVDRRRTLVFTVEGGQGSGFKIDGKEFDETRVDQTIPLNALEEWTIRNDSDVWHPFHIHVNPFQLTHVNGSAVSAPSYVDTVPIAPRGSITFRIRFLDFPGKSVFHCHIVPHSDGGMMGLFNVLEPGGRSSQPRAADRPSAEPVAALGDRAFSSTTASPLAGDYVCEIPGVGAGVGPPLGELVSAPSRPGST